tara:strand:- start:23 stop:430 length:408 start_codon:yes stop_codon:yes gene_type:complete
MDIDLEYITYLLKTKIKFKNKCQYYNVNKKLKSNDKTDLLTQIIYLYAEAYKSMDTKFIYTDQIDDKDKKELEELRDFKNKYISMKKSNDKKLEIIKELKLEIDNMNITINNLKYDISILDGTEEGCILDYDKIK